MQEYSANFDETQGDEEEYEQEMKLIMNDNDKIDRLLKDLEKSRKKIIKRCMPLLSSSTRSLAKDCSHTIKNAKYQAY